MSSVAYHIEAETREEFEKILRKMEEAEDPALCCARIVWKPTKNVRKEESK